MNTAAKNAGMASAMSSHLTSLSEAAMRQPTITSTPAVAALGTAEMTGEDVTACAAAFCETVTAAGYDAAVYGNRWQGYYDYDFAQLKDYAFWVSAPGTADDFYYAHDFWQYSYDGTVPGVSGSVDRDLWFVPITP